MVKKQEKAGEHGSQGRIFERMYVETLCEHRGFGLYVLKYAFFTHLVDDIQIFRQLAVLYRNPSEHLSMHMK